MRSSVAVKVAHRTDASLSYEMKMDCRSLGMSERLMSACKFLVIWWVAAIVLILVPVLHFFLVPMAAVAGIYVFVQRMRLQAFHDEMKLLCPSCKTELPLKARSFCWPLNEMCSNCRASVVISKI